MDPVVFSGGQPAAFGIAAFCTVVLPVILLIVLGVMKKISAGPLFLGFASFFVSQMVLRIPLLQVLGGQSWFQSFAAHTAVYALVVGGFTAGLFEETARLAGAAVLKKKLSYKSMLSFGLGHGLCEVILIAGMSQVNNLILCAALADPQGAAATAFLSGVDPATLQAVAAQLTAATPALVGLALVERVSAVLYHLFGTCLVFTAVKRGKPLYYFAALLAHTLFNFLAVMLNAWVGPWIMEAVLLAAGVCFGLYVWRARRWFDAPCGAGAPTAPQALPGGTE